MHKALRNQIPPALQTALLATLLGLAPLVAQAASPTFSNLYIFGDSYCDVGNLFIATKGADPAPPYFNGRFSNGPLWVDHVEGFLSLPALKPSLAGGTDFAFAGAEVTAPHITAVGTIPSVPQQVALYLESVGGKADPRALYILEGGGNDILDATGGSPQELGYQIALGIAESELELRQAGARNFLIPDLFNVGLLPLGQANAAFASAATTATNEWLDRLLAVEDFLEGIHIIRLDVFDLANAIQTDPTHFGFTNITAPCVSPVTNAVCADPDHTFFWDEEHVTEFGQGFFAVTVENTLATRRW
jgi:phospholipase/lecithinase/hemolysin